MSEINRTNLSRDAVVIALAGIGGVVFSLDWISRSLLVLFAIGLTIYAARRHSAHSIWRAIGALVIIGLFVGLSWRPIWADFQEKYPNIANLPVLRSAANGPKLEFKVAATFLAQSVIDNRMTAGTIIIASVTNVGSVQTIATNYRVAAIKDGNVYQGVVLGCPKTFSVVPYFPEDKSGPMQFFDEDALYNKTATPIIPGNQVVGFLLVSFPTVSDYRALRGGYRIDIAFEDAFANRYFDIAIPTPGSVTTDFRSARKVYPGMHTKFPEK
jgi:hypothetical protein